MSYAEFSIFSSGQRILHSPVRFVTFLDNTMQTYLHSQQKMKQKKTTTTYFCAKYLKYRIVQELGPPQLWLWYQFHLTEPQGGFNLVHNIHHKVPCSWWSEGEEWCNLCLGRFPETNTHTLSHIHHATAINTHDKLTNSLTLQNKLAIIASSRKRSQCLIVYYLESVC